MFDLPVARRRARLARRTGVYCTRRASPAVPHCNISSDVHRYIASGFARLRHCVPPLNHSTGHDHQRSCCRKWWITGRLPTHAQCKFQEAKKVITLRRQLTLLAFELQPHPSFSAIRRQGDSYTRGTQPAVLPMPRSLTEASRANL